MLKSFGSIPMYPGIDTKFHRVTEAQGVWTERCQACGDCKLHITGEFVLLVVAQESLNGPCGGFFKREVRRKPELTVWWQLIYDRLKDWAS